MKKHTLTDDEFNEWMRKLYQEHYGVLFRHIRSLCYRYNRSLLDYAEDYTQDTFSLLWQHRRKVYRYNKPVSWLYKTATNVFRNEHQKWQRRSKYDAGADAAESTFADETFEPEAVAMLEAQRESIVKRIGEENYAFLLRYYDDTVSRAVLAQELGVSSAALRVRVFRMISPLRGDLIIFLLLLRNI